MLNVKKLLTKVTSWLDTPIKITSITLGGISITANGTYTNTAVDVSSAIPSGYKMIAVLPKASGTNTCYFYHCGVTDATTAVIQIRNISSAGTIYPILDIVSIKDI